MSTIFAIILVIIFLGFMIWRLCDLFNLFPKCVFCGHRTDDLKMVKYGRFDEVNHYNYHTCCLDNVLLNPKQYEVKKLDKAIHIVDLIKREKCEEVDATAQREKRLKNSLEFLIKEKTSKTNE